MFSKSEVHVGRVRIAALLLAAAVAAGCEKAQLLAPTNSTITVSAAARILPLGGTTQITATLLEQGGTPVQNGTTVRFSTTLGSVDPVEAQTRNGIAVTTFSAGNVSGIADVRAISGAATGTTTGGSTGTTTNVVQITIGAAAVNTVTLRANPGSVGPAGGTVELIATVVGENGRVLPDIGVTFNTDQGSLSASTATTDSNGEARVGLTTTQKTSVTATAGTKTSSAVTVDLRAGPGVTISCAPSSGSGNCSAVQASASNTATVVFTIAKTSSSSNLRTATLDFGDGGSQSLGNLAGSTTVTHVYTGPSGSSPRSYTATVQATDINGETSSAATTVIITARTALTVTFTATEGTKTTTSARWTFAADTKEGSTDVDGEVESYKWDFGDETTATTSGPSTSHVYASKGTMIVTVTVKKGGREATAREEIIVSFSTALSP